MQNKSFGQTTTRLLDKKKKKKEKKSWLTRPPMNLQ